MKRSVVVAILLAGCSAPVANDSATMTAVDDRGEPAPQPTPARSSVHVPPAAPLPDREALGAVLPARLVGRWAVRPDQCPEGSELGITIEPSLIRFYESVARITRVTPVGDGTVGVDAEVTGEGETEPRSFDLKPSADGARLTRVQASIPDITYIRCERQK